MEVTVRCAERVEIRALPGIPIVAEGDDLAALVLTALQGAHLELRDGDVLVVTSKIVSRAEGCFVDLGTVVPGARAEEIGRAIGKDARLVELILRDTDVISRSAPGVLVVRHRLGFIAANAGIDCSNAAPPRCLFSNWENTIVVISSQKIRVSLQANILILL